MAKRASGPRPRPEAGTGEWRNGKWTGKWMFSFTSAHPRPDGGRRQIFRRGFPTRRAAQEELNRLLAEDRPPEADGLTVAMVLDDFVAEKTVAGRAPNTIAQHRWAAERAKDLWGGWSAEQLTYRHLNAQYVTWQQRGRKQFRRGQGTTTTDAPLSNRSIEAFHRSVKAAFQLAVNRGLLPTNPAELATPPSVGEQELRWWSPRQVGTFIAYDHSTNDLPTGMVDVLADTGGRRGETCALRWNDLDLDAGTATIARQFVIHPDTNQVEARPTKRPRSKATISLHPDTVAALRRRHAEQATERLAMGNGWPGPKSLAYDCVFTWGDGRLVRPDTLTRIVDRMSTAAGLPRLTPHGLRHSFATAALKARVPVEVVAARLGNTTRVVQEIYAHVIPSDDQAAAQLVGDLYRTPKTGRGDPQKIPSDGEEDDTERHEASAS
jgi:integrase